MLLFRLKRYITIKTTPNNLPRLNLLEHGYIFIDRKAINFLANNSSTKAINEQYVTHIYWNEVDAVLYMRKKYETVVNNGNIMLYTENNATYEKSILFDKPHKRHRYKYNSGKYIKEWEYCENKLEKITYKLCQTEDDRILIYDVYSGKIIVRYTKYLCDKFYNNYYTLYQAIIYYGVKETVIKLIFINDDNTYYNCNLTYRKKQLVKYQTYDPEEYYVKA